MIVAIDPGNDTGAALFSRGGVELKHVEVIPRTILALSPWILRYAISTVVVELPQIYRASRSKGDPNLLVPLILQAGWIEALAYVRGIQCVMVKPREWKGQVPKGIHHARIRASLSARELEVANVCLEKITPSKRHNAWDAIGLGQWFVRKAKT